MNIEYLKQCVAEGKSTRKIARERNVSQSTIRYWLRRYGLTTRCSTPGTTWRRYTHCKVCGKATKRGQLCPGCRTNVRRYRAKAAAVKLKGGKCERCGWSGNLAAFEFHHKDDNKHFAIGGAANKSWAVVRREVLKCELLCSNCHRTLHTTRGSAAFMHAVQNYQGDLLDFNPEA